MEREEAIRILDMKTSAKALAEIEYHNGFSGREAVLKAIDDACVLAVAALREQDQRRWIPVTERLPEDGEKVLTQKNGFIEVQRYRKNRNGWMSGNWFWPMATVTHWMPLPDPPEPQKGE